MSAPDWALELGRALGWFGGALYLVDVIGARLNRWRMDREIQRAFRRGSLYPGSGTPPPAMPPDLHIVPVPGGPRPVSSSRPAGAGRPPRPVE